MFTKNVFNENDLNNNDWLFCCLNLISFSKQSLQRTEDGVMGSNSDQDVL